jgi:hypothetical protein
MYGPIFESWLKEWDRTLKPDERKVLLYLDNFSGHSKIKLEQINVKFFPANTTAASQPCDQGIIQNLKMWTTIGDSSSVIEFLPLTSIKIIKLIFFRRFAFFVELGIPSSLKQLSDVSVRRDL